jgi:hypothetical protein
MTRKKRTSAHSPKGSYPHPAGGYFTDHLGPTDHQGRRLRLRVWHRAQPDAEKIAESCSNSHRKNSRIGTTSSSSTLALVLALVASFVDY